MCLTMSLAHHMPWICSVLLITSTGQAIAGSGDGDLEKPLEPEKANAAGVQV